MSISIEDIVDMPGISPVFRSEGSWPRCQAVDVIRAARWLFA
jgi:hypothetical protein